MRLSGPDSVGIVSELLAAPAELRDRQAIVTTIVDGSGTPIDEVVLITFLSPRSYTGEDVVEVSCHGSPLILDTVVRGCLSRGARAARPGEFTLRAFLNGRMDLSQAEAVADLVDARSEAGLGLALQQLHGRLSERVEPIRSRLLESLAHIIAIIEFSEEDIPALEASAVVGNLRECESEISALLSRASAGSVLQHGVGLTIVGRANAGKSSILNGLLGRDRAIVSAVPGTTRDTLEEELTIGGVLFRAVDTAGLNTTSDEVERLGIARTWAAAEAADIVLVVIDGTRELNEGADLPSVQEVVLNPAQKLVVAINKTDLPCRVTLDQAMTRFSQAPVVGTCALRPDGLDDLKRTLVESALDGPAPDGFVVSNERHIQLLREAREATHQAARSLDEGVPLDLIAIDVGVGVERLGEILGRSVGDDVLDRVFARFCIGK